MVVGGGTTLNGASQITNGGTNAGSNLSAVRNLFTASDQVTLTHGKHLLSVGVWFQRIQANDTLMQDQYGQASFTNLPTFLAGHGEHLHLRAGVHAAGLAFARRRVLRGRHHQAEAEPRTELGFRGEFTNGWNEAAWPRLELSFSPNGVIETQPTIGNSALAREQREVPAGAARRHRLVALSVEENRDSRRLWHLLRAARQSELPAGPEPAVQHRLRRERVTAAGVAHTLQLREHQPDGQLFGAWVQQFRDPQRRAAKSADADGGILHAENRAAAFRRHHAERGLYRFARLPRIAFDRREPARRAAYPYPTQVITATSTGLANPAVWNTTHWFSRESAPTTAWRWT